MSEESDGPPTTRLRPRTQGRSVPIPPLLPSVAIASLVLGLVLGFGLAPKPGPPPGGSLASIPAFIPASQAPAATPLELPPAGLTLSQALAALKLAAVGTDSAFALLSARIARYGDAASGALPADRWVWAFVVRRSLDPASCGPAGSSAQPCPLSGATELAIFDYQTGEFLEDRIPAYP